ncbi:hypothetical protein HDV62DRAFT_360274, partial [Trichoderma sp. SZMC 28011]
MAMHSRLHPFSLWASHFTMMLSLYLWGGLLFWPAPIFCSAILALLLGYCLIPSVTLPTRLSTLLLCLSVAHSLLLFFLSSFSIES